ncbi:MAG: hypothetical protein BMS9Abin28_2237 [Anaerolineae bacterium]|nr:MAG: hypothetical protein BMS9Abin28_2237 [Anaerolineae bacterium]
MNKLRIATIGVLAVSLLLPSAVFAQEEMPERPEGRIRAAGEISGVVPGQGTFTLTTRKGEELEFQTNESTKFRSPNGTVEGIHDLKKGMKAFVVATEQDDGPLLALMVAAGRPEDLPEGKRLGGVIESINLDAQSFTLKPRDGDLVRIQAGERTRFRGEGIDGLSDLDPGMRARVVVIEQEEGGLMALLVAAGKPKDRPEVIKLGGEITGVVPGRGTFTLMSREGEELELSTNDRTKFRSRDGSVQGINDLKVGMLAMVGAVRQDDGQLLALVVAVGNPEDRPKLDVKALGRVIDKGGNSFTIEKRNGEQISFSVSDNTRYKGIGGFSELEVGMMAAVGAKETDDGLLAVFVGARNPEDRPNRDPQDHPQDRPERGPDRRGPGQDQGKGQDVSA